MTDPHGGPSDATDAEPAAPPASPQESTVPVDNDFDQTVSLDGDPTDRTVPFVTVPFVPDAGYRPAAPQPLPEATMVDPLGTNDPWASGPGLGSAATPFPTPPAPAPAAPPVGAPAASSWPYPQPAWQPPPPGSPSPRAVANTGYGQEPAPAAWPPPAQPSERHTPAPQPVAPAPAPRPWNDGYAEPDGPASSLPDVSAPYPPYAPSPYAGQQWPAPLPNPVAHSYGYGGFHAAVDHPNATMSLVLGIIGLIFFPPLAPFAWYLAAKGQREARLDPGRWRTGGMIVVGKVLGILGTAILSFLTLLILFALVSVVLFSA